MPRNPGGYMEYSGNIIAGGKIRRIQAIRSSDGFINLSYNQMPFTASFDPFQVEWGTVTKVQVDLFRKFGSSSDQKTDILSLQFMQPPQGKPSEKQYYTFMADLNGGVIDVEYYWSATYYHTAGPDTYAPQTGSELKSIVLPKDGTVPQLTVHRMFGNYSVVEEAVAV